MPSPLSSFFHLLDLSEFSLLDAVFNFRSRYLTITYNTSLTMFELERVQLASGPLSDKLRQMRSSKDGSDLRIPPYQFEELLREEYRQHLVRERQRKLRALIS